MNHNLYFLYTKVQRDLNSVPKDVKTLIFGLFVYVLAWGIIDPFFSIFIKSVVKSYSLTGLFYGMFFLSGVILSIPVGGLAEKVNRIKFTILSLLSYPVIGILYFFVVFVASEFALLLLLIALIFHGITSNFWVMAESFIREKSPKGETSAAFGLYITFQKLSVVIAPIFIIALVWLFGLSLENIHWTFLALLVFPILAVLSILKIKDRGMSFGKGVREVVEKDGVIKKELQDLKKMGFIGYFTLIMGFFMRSIGAIISFLIPLYAISLNLSLIEISFLFAAISLPFLLSFFFAELADSFGKTNVIAIGFALAALALLAISFSSGASIMFFAACFVLGLILAILQPAVNGLITDITPRVQDGEITGVLSAVLKISSFVTAIALGIMADFFGLAFPFMVFAVILLIMSVLTFSIKSRIVVRI